MLKTGVSLLTGCKGSFTGVLARYFINMDIAGNNGLLYVTVAAKALVLAVDVSRGNILWQKSFGPLSMAYYAPAVDSNGYAIYVSQTQIEEKFTRIIGDYTYISAMKSKGVIFMLINPATGTIFWSEQYPVHKISFLELCGNLKRFTLQFVGA
ncbi:hypothetical protein HAX54_012114 [Datura stramonium]|uniref:Uncharacterized protein n=1 Tax=Datura stramonium TaxID=4076 RepID=A0ABS8RII6_DATST|nr:hypothetical protein [Datura stramonium]